MTDMHKHNPTAGGGESSDSSDLLRQELVREINRLSRLSSRGIMALSLFLVVSLFAWWGFPLFPAPDTVIAVLGRPPTARMVSIALLLYTFSATILSLTRMIAGVEHRSSFVHVGFLTGFFLFYYFGKALEDNYWAVLGSGITILGVESYRIWSFCSEGIAKNREDMEYIDRTGRRPPQE
jgi:hypothetical protein